MKKSFVKIIASAVFTFILAVVGKCDNAEIVMQSRKAAEQGDAIAQEALLDIDTP